MNHIHRLACVAPKTNPWRPARQGRCQSAGAWLMLDKLIVLVEEPSMEMDLASLKVSHKMRN